MDFLLECQCNSSFLVETDQFLAILVKEGCVGEGQPDLHCHVQYIFSQILNEINSELLRETVTVIFHSSIKNSPTFVHRSTLHMQYSRGKLHNQLNFIPIS